VRGIVLLMIQNAKASSLDCGVVTDLYILLSAGRPVRQRFILLYTNSCIVERKVTPSVNIPARRAVVSARHRKRERARARDYRVLSTARMPPAGSEQ
jgi:hypothetical protein